MKKKIGTKRSFVSVTIFEYNIGKWPLIRGSLRSSSLFYFRSFPSFLSFMFFHRLTSCPVIGCTCRPNSKTPEDLLVTLSSGRHPGEVGQTSVLSERNSQSWLVLPEKLVPSSRRSRNFSCPFRVQEESWWEWPFVPFIGSGYPCPLWIIYPSLYSTRVIRPVVELIHCYSMCGVHLFRSLYPNTNPSYPSRHVLHQTPVRSLESGDFFEGVGGQV